MDRDHCGPAGCQGTEALDQREDGLPAEVRGRVDEVNDRRQVAVTVVVDDGRTGFIGPAPAGSGSVQEVMVRQPAGFRAEAPVT